MLLVNNFNLYSIKKLIGNIGEIDYSLSEEYKEIEGIYSNNAIVIDRAEGEVILGKSRLERINPASMTKVMTALIGIENAKNLNKRVKIGSDVINYCVREGMSQSGFEAEDNPRIKDLLYGILLESGGESSISLAYEISGSEDEFVKLMNKKAESIGMYNTHFSNSSGITDSNNYSTTEDIAKLFDYALKNKIFKKIIMSKDHIAQPNKTLFSKHKITNNVFHKRNILDISKNYLKGGKTGYTEAAGLCLVSFGEKSDKEYIVVSAGAEGNPSTIQYNFLDLKTIYDNI